MQTKYAIRTICLSQGPCYLQQGQYDLAFTCGTDPDKFHYFNSREEAIRWLDANHDESRCFEIVEVFIP